MITMFFPVKKLRRNRICVLFGAILLVAAVAVYHEMVAATAWREGSGSIPDDGSGWRSNLYDQWVGAEDSGFMPQAWKPEYKGQANLHVFEDWCGSSTDGLRRNLHYPLHPHSRTTVRKLAVSPQWTNYGLRIFGYLHPYADGEFVFALSSNDNSEFWLSTNDSPAHLQLLAWVGKTGSEWTAPGEFEKYASQISKATQLSVHRRYFFELIHKQNDRGTDHVEVAWKLFEDLRFMVIDSNYISLYVNESALLMSDVSHIPQTVASHRSGTPRKRSATTADLLKEDPRDAFHQVPLIDGSFLQDVLPNCLYKPSYTIKDFPITRYQGLQFVHMSYVYPNDYTRLTHMEGENSCFYSENPNYMKKFGFSRYMRLDRPDELEKKNAAGDYSFQKRKSILGEDNKFGRDMYQGQMEAKAALKRGPLPDYGDDYDDYALKWRRKLSSLALNDANDTLKKSAYGSRHKAEMGRGVTQQKRVAEIVHLVATESTKQQKRPVKIAANVKPKGRQKSAKGPNHKSVEKTQQLKPPLKKKKLAPKHITSRRTNVKTNKTYVQKYKKSLQPVNTDAPKPAPTEVPNRQNRTDSSDVDTDSFWEPEEDEDLTPAPVFDAEVDWSQTFQLHHVDLQAMRSDWINLLCNISGNLLLGSNDAFPVAKAFLAQLNKKHGNPFTLVRVVNVEKHLDGAHGSRYLLELELKDTKGQLLRLSHYIYVLVRHQRARARRQDSRRAKPQLVLCNPVGFRWNPVAMVHFIVPVKNQARWVQLLIDDMADLFKATGDANFNLIITDYNSTDMDVRMALKKSSLPRYQYVKLSGNFERSAGLQAGIDLIDDDHSIVFLCDLHIHFPPSILDSIRKHCIEGFMAFAPILMRLDCGATPLEGRGSGEPIWGEAREILQAGLEVERIHLRNFFHHYHSRRGMWNHRMWSGPR
ncbi:beta-1,4-N-acetylgalactosaminyltransferase 3 isoform X2 [Festucalex cinctus]